MPDVASMLMEKYPDGGGVKAAPRKKPESKDSKAAMSNLKVDAYVDTYTPDPAQEKKYLKEQEARILKSRKMAKDILTQWDPGIVATKARRKFEEDVKQYSDRLKEIREKLAALNKG